MGKLFFAVVLAALLWVFFVFLYIWKFTAVAHWLVLAMAMWETARILRAVAQGIRRGKHALLEELSHGK